MSNARLLFRLQELDREVQVAYATAAKLKARLGESDDLRAARQRLSEAKMRLRQADKAQKEGESQLQAISNKLAGSQQRLYGGSIRNPKELRGLEEEVIHLTQRRDQSEEETLQAILEAEEAVEELRAAETSLAVVEERWSSEQKQTSAEMEQLRICLEKLLGSRDQICSRVTPAEIDIYEELRRKKGKTPVAKLAGDTCQSCGVSLPVAVARQARVSDELVFCTSCGRLLVTE